MAAPLLVDYEPKRDGNLGFLPHIYFYETRQEPKSTQPIGGEGPPQAQTIRECRLA